MISRMAFGRSIILPAGFLATAVLCGAVPGTGSRAGARAAEPAGLPVLHLRQCVEIALEGSVSLAVSREQIEQAAQDLKAAKWAFFPDLTVSHTYAKDQRTDFDADQFDLIPIPFVDTGNDTLFFNDRIPNGTVADEKTETSYRDVRAATNWNVFSGLEKWSALGSARNGLKAAEAGELYGRELVIQNVASAYYDLLRFERLLEVAQETRDLAARELEKSETYFRLGSVAKSDVLMARVRLEQTRLDLVRAENSVEQAFADLAYAMNRPLAARFQIDRSPLETDFALEKVESLYSEALQGRLDLKSRQYDLAAAGNAVTSAGSSMWPRVDLFASYQYYNNESPFRFGSQKSDLLRYGYQVTWNVFDRMATWTNRSKAKASERIAEYNLEQAQLDAQLEIRQLYNLLVEARERAHHSREFIIQSQEELRLAQERFRVGAGTTLDRITAEVNLAQARAEEIKAICDFLINRIKLERAVGRSSALSESPR